MGIDQGEGYDPTKPSNVEFKPTRHLEAVPGTPHKESFWKKVHEFSKAEITVKNPFKGIGKKITESWKWLTSEDETDDEQKIPNERWREDHLDDLENTLKSISTEEIDDITRQKLLKEFREQRPILLGITRRDCIACANNVINQLIRNSDILDRITEDPEGLGDTISALKEDLSSEKENEVLDYSFWYEIVPDRVLRKKAIEYYQNHILKFNQARTEDLQPDLTPENK